MPYTTMNGLELKFMGIPILQVTVKSPKERESELVPSGFIIDFKELKEIVNTKVINLLDHKLVLSYDYMNSLESYTSFNNLLRLEMEPTAENLLLLISKN